MTDKELYDFHTKKLAELPGDIIEQAVHVVLSVLDETTKNAIKKVAKSNPYAWAIGYHFYWGMWMRNQFRADAGITDDQLPSGNWDDYYVPIVELALGLRSLAQML